MDHSAEIAKKYATVIEEHHQVPRIEDIHPVYIPKLKHDWFILIDPDERIRKELAEDIIAYVENPEPYKSLIRTYFWYYFKGKKLKGGPYQNAIRGRLLFYRPGINISDEVHTGITAKAGYGIAEIPFTGLNYDEHYWCNSWVQLKDKHTRYAKGEGKVLYQKGKRFTVFHLLLQTLKTYFFALIKQGYYKDQLTGFRFSYYEARYTFLSWVSLSKYQHELKARGELKSKAEVAKEQIINKVQEFLITTEQVKRAYKLEPDPHLQEQMLLQFQKSLHRLVNEGLELNEFEWAEKAIKEASFNDSMHQFIVNGLLIDRLKLIQNSGSYRFIRNVKKYSIF